MIDAQCILHGDLGESFESYFLIQLEAKGRNQNAYVLITCKSIASLFGCLDKGVEITSASKNSCRDGLSS